jgi:hypothetical protein
MLKTIKKITEEMHHADAVALEFPLFSALTGLATVPGITPEIVDEWIEKAAVLSEVVAGAPLTVVDHLMPIIADTTPVVIAPASALVSAFAPAGVMAKVPKLPKEF